MEAKSLFEVKGKGCVFCQIVKGELKSHQVFEDEVSLVFLDHRPLLQGHCVLVPKKHYETFLDLPRKLIAPVFKDVQLLAAAVERGMKADGSFVAVNTRISQSVPHLHIHIVPRWQGDHLFSTKMIWMREPYKDEAAARAVQKAIKDAVKKLLEK